MESIEITVYKGNTIRQEDIHQTCDVLRPILEEAGFQIREARLGLIARHPGTQIEIWITRAD